MKERIKEGIGTRFWIGKWRVSLAIPATKAFFYVHDTHPYPRQWMMAFLWIEIFIIDWKAATKLEREAKVKPAAEGGTA